MAVPSTGEISMEGLAKEKKYDDYNSASPITGPISLIDLVLGGNANGSGEDYDVTNPLSTSKPDEIEPHGMEEWYGYDHAAGDSCSSYTSISLYPQTSLNCDTSKPPLTFYINNSVWSSATLLLKDSGSGNCISADVGYYYCGSCSQNGTEVRYWDGNSFTSSSGCP